MTPNDFDFSSLSNSVGTCGADVTIDDCLAALERWRRYGSLAAFEQRRDDAYQESLAFIAAHLPGQDSHAIYAAAVADLKAEIATRRAPADVARRYTKRSARKVRMARKRRRGWA